VSAVNYTPPGSLVDFLQSTKFVSLVVGPYGCVAADTLVLTEKGPTPIADITQPTRVVSWNEKTCRYQLSWCDSAFPKGTDYLYRVATQDGEFVASGQHQLLLASGEYRPVQALRPGDALASYSDSLHPSIAELCLSASPEDGPRCSETHVSYLGDCAELNRLCGLPFLPVADSGPVFAPVLAGVPESVSHESDQNVLLHTGGRLGRLPSRIRYALFGARQRIDDFLHRVLRPVGGSAHGDEGCGGHSEAIAQRWLQFPWSLIRRPLRQVPFSRTGSLEAPSYSTTKRSTAIVSITREEVKRKYWDLQVQGTHNYVTVDGAVHHNSTKTTAGIMKIAYMAKRVAPSRDGIRRSRAAWIRNTREQLNDTSIPDFLKWFPDGAAGKFMKTGLKFLLKFDDVECEVLFRGLDDSNDVRRLLSLQLTFGIMDEFREINPDIYEALTGRVGRYPDGMMVPHREEWGNDKNGNPIQGCVTDQGKAADAIWGMSNPPDYDTFWEGLLSDPPENMHVTIQPSGLSPEADWVHFLKPDYYENLAIGKTEDWVDVYIHSKFGKSLSGQPVFKSFHRETHVAKTPFKRAVDSSAPLIIGVDAGLTPAAVIGQVIYDGRVIVYDALTSDGMGALRFVREKLKPLIANKFPGMASVVIIDPAARQRAQTDERTVMDIYKAEGFTVKTAKTNAIAARIAAVDNFLTRTFDGKAGILFDPEGAVDLVRAMGGKYRYKINTKGEMDEKPEKTHPWSDIADALQYLCLHADGNEQGGLAQNQNYRREVTRVSARGWT